MDFARHLNEEQLRAVTAPPGPVLVIAAADRMNIAIVGLDSGLPPAPLRPV